MWYTPEEALRRSGIFFNSVTLAGAFGSLLASGINHMDGTRGKAGWQWIFIIEGLATVIIGLGAFFLVPDSPEESEWLDPADRVFIKERVKVIEGTEQQESQGLRSNLATYFSDYKSYLAGLLYFGE